MTPTKIGENKHPSLDFIMKTQIHNIRDTKNPDFKMIDFMPYRDQDGVVHIIDAKVILTEFVEALQLVKGDFVQL